MVIAAVQFLTEISDRPNCTLRGVALRTMNDFMRTPSRFYAYALAILCVRSRARLMCANGILLYVILYAYIVSSTRFSIRFHARKVDWAF